MSSPLIRGKGRTVASLSMAASLILSTAALAAATTAPAQSAAPADCAAPADIALLEDGDLVTSLTVSDGTTPDTLEGEVLGVLDDGIAPDLDMVIVDFSGNPEIDTPTGPGGIWQGMSGSPVYDDEGDLIGAVAYGMAWGPSPIAGVTPFADMADYLDTLRPARVEVGKGMARRIAASSALSAAQAEQGLRQLRMPMGVSGLSPERLAKATNQLRRYLPKSTYVGSKPSARAAGPETIIDGGNLAASVSYGDITQAGVGTATDVCGGEVVGFGHPMTFGGKTTMSMHPADAIYIQEDPVGAPFKVANLGSPAGVIDEDHLTGITGVLGAAPDAAEITSSVTYGSNSRTGSSKVTVTDFAPGTTFYQSLANHDRVVDAIKKGSENQSWTIKGTDGGAPFTLSSGDRFVSDFDISFEASFDLADIVYLLTSVPGLTIDSVSVNGVVSDKTASYRVTGMEQYKKGEWTRVSRRNPATVRAGKILKLRAVLRNSDGADLRVPFKFKVNKRLAGSRGFLYLTGGNDYFSDDFFYELYEGGSTSLADVKKMLADQLRNDEIQASLRIFSEGPAEGECRGCKANGSVEKDQVLGPVDQVVSGFKQIKVLVKG